jgi:hypothetical protein
MGVRWEPWHLGFKPSKDLVLKLFPLFLLSRLVNHTREHNIREVGHQLGLNSFEYEYLIPDT